MFNINDPSLVFEHEVRHRVRKVKQAIEAATGYAYADVSYSSDKDGSWRISTYHNGSVSTSGAVLEATMLEHLRRMGVENELKILPALLEAPDTRYDE